MEILLAADPFELKIGLYGGTSLPLVALRENSSLNQLLQNLF